MLAKWKAWLESRNIRRADSSTITTTTGSGIGRSSVSGLVLGHVETRSSETKTHNVNYAKPFCTKTTLVAIYQMEDITSVSAVGPLGSLCHQEAGVDIKAATGGLYTIH